MRPKSRTASVQARRGGAARLLTSVLLLAAGVGPVTAQVAPSPEQQRTLEVVALAKARVALYERVRALPLEDGLTVGQWLDQSGQRDRALRLATRGRFREGRGRLYSDALAEADVCITPAEIRDLLLSILQSDTEPTERAGVDSRRLRTAALQWRTVCTTGRAALSKTTGRDQPPGWEDVSARGAEQARAAATADAHAALLARVERLDVAGGRQLREFLDSAAAVRSAMSAELRRVATINVELAPDQVAVVEVRVNMRDLLRILTRVHQELYRGDEFAAADFRQMYLQVEQTDLIATGLATPPSHTRLPSAHKPTEMDVPEWAANTLTATGRYAPADDESPSAAALREAARLDGAARVYEQIAGLTVRERVSVAEFLGYHQELKDDVALFVSGARPVTQLERGADGVRIEVELPLRRLWEILRRGMTLEEVLPPADKESP